MVDGQGGVTHIDKLIAISGFVQIFGCVLSMTAEEGGGARRPVLSRRYLEGQSPQNKYAEKPYLFSIVVTNATPWREQAKLFVLPFLRDEMERD